MAGNHGITFTAVGHTAPDGDYYFARPELPALVDLSRCVMFFRPHGGEEEGDKFSLDVVIKTDTGRKNRGDKGRK